MKKIAVILALVAHSGTALYADGLPADVLSTQLINKLDLAFNRSFGSVSDYAFKGASINYSPMDDVMVSYANFVHDYGYNDSDLKKISAALFQSYKDIKQLFFSSNSIKLSQDLELALAMAKKSAVYRSSGAGVQEITENDVANAQRLDVLIARKDAEVNKIFDSLTKTKKQFKTAFYVQNRQDKLAVSKALQAYTDTLLTIVTKYKNQLKAMSIDPSIVGLRKLIKK